MGGTPGYRPRLADRRLRHLVATFPAVLVNGPRGAGKTTTAEQVCASVVRLDQPGAAAAFRADPDAALRTLYRPTLIDEWQEVPEVLGAVKRAVDAEGKPGSFVLTGSVRADLEQQMWPGTGRLVRIALHGLTEREITGNLEPGRPSFLDRLATANLDEITVPPAPPDLVGYVDLALRGGLPEVALRAWSADDRATWLDSYLEQLLTRDVAALERAPREPEKLRRYFEATALTTAGMPTGKTLYEAAGITAKTAASYDHLLASLFVLDRLPAWSTNRLARLVTLAKRYITDPGLVGSAAGMTTRSVLANGDMLGRLIDTFTLAQLRPELVLSARRRRAYHLRTQGGRQEIDLVVELEAGNVLGLEVKATAAPNRQDARHLCWLRDGIGERFLAGAVLHTGPYAFPLDERIFAVPICAIWG